MIAICARALAWEMGDDDAFCRVELLRLKVDRRAVTAIEYALIVALIAVAIMGAVGGFGGNASAVFNKISSEL